MIFKAFTDAGHGKGNLGTHDKIAVTQKDGSQIWRPDPNGLIEKYLVLDIEDRLHASINGLPFTVGRSRSFDHEMTQYHRGKSSTKYEALFVGSIHINDNPDPRVGGVQLYVKNGNPRSHALANEFAPAWARLFGGCEVIKASKPEDPSELGISEEEKAKRLRARWIEHPLAILNAHIADVVLFEIGFRRNEHDRKILMSELGRAEIAAILYWCLIRAARRYGS